MSSVPPYSAPPGGGAPPPYDPKTQWRVYREQQRAAWRAQREAWRAQKHAWKAGMTGDYVPRAPSVVGPLILLGVGIVAMLIYAGKIDASSFWAWYGRWWPLLLIGAGLAMLGEWFLDMRRKVPVRRGRGFVGILVLLAFMGLCAAWAHQYWDPMRANWGDHDDFFNMFGRPQHDLDQQVLNAQVPGNAVVEIQNPRGDVSVTAAEDSSKVQVEAHEVAYANTDDEAKKIFSAEAAHVAVTGSSVLVKSEGHNSGRVDLRVTVPRSAQVTVNASRGDVTVAGLGHGVNITAAHGDVQLSTIQGSVQVHFSNDKGDLSAHQITGDVTTDGRCNDLTLSEVKGKVTVAGDIFGTAHLENLIGGVHLHTPVTDMQLGDLPGDITLDQEDLRVTEAKGPIRVVTESKNVELSQIYGDTFVQDRDGNISIAPAGSYNVDAKSSRGNADIEITLPPNVSANLDVQTHNGDILSDFPAPSSGNEGGAKSAKFSVGSGRAKIVLSTEVGDVRIKRGSEVPGSPPAVSSGSPLPPPAPGAPHLKAPKTPPAAPVTQ